MRKTDWTQEELQQRMDMLDQLLSEGILFDGPCYDTAIENLYNLGYRGPDWESDASEN